MADEKKIIIEILDSSNSREKQNGTSDEETQEDGLSKTLNKIFHPIRNVETATFGKNVILMQAYQQAKQQTIRTVEFYANRYFSLKEDYLSETTYSNAKTAISKVTGFAGAIGAGAIAGAKLGPAGAILGGIVGATGYGINEYISSVQTRQGYYQRLNAINYETNFAQFRAGLVDNSKGTEN